MKKLLIAVCTVLAVGVMAIPAEAQVQFGPQLSYADDFDFGIGARAQFDLGSAVDEGGTFGDLRGVVSFDYFFPDCELGDCSYIEINGNALYPFDVEGEVEPYVGAGVNIARVSVEDVSDTEVGLNALGGINFGLGPFMAFSEARIELSGGEQFVLTFGALFGGD